MELISRKLIENNPGIKKITDIMFEFRNRYWGDTGLLCTVRTLKFQNGSSTNVDYFYTLQESDELLQNHSLKKWPISFSKGYSSGCIPVEVYKKIKSDAHVIEEDTDTITIEYGNAPLRPIDKNEENNFLLSNRTFMKKSDKVYPYYVLNDGTTIDVPIYYNTKDGLSYIITYVNDNNEVINEIDKIPRNCGDNITVNCFQPLKWIVDKESGIAVATRAVFYGEHFKEKNYQDSGIHKIFNSIEFLKVFTDNQTIIKNEDEKSNRKRIFDKRKKTTNIIDILKQSMPGGRIPYLVGHPGIGKTTIVKNLSPYCLSINVSSFSPDKFTGKSGIIYNNPNSLPNENRSSEPYTKTFEPDWHKNLIAISKKASTNKERCILFIDEFDKLAPQMQVFINSLVETPRKLADWIIPENVDVVLAGNTKEYSDASFPISGEVESRLVRYVVEPDLKNWLNWANNVNIDPLIRSFLYNNGNYFMKDVKVNGKFDYSKSLMPRSWAQKINEELLAARNLGTYPLLEYYMSDEDRRVFEDFIDNYPKLADKFPDEIIKGEWEQADFILTDDIEKVNFVNYLIPITYSDSELEHCLKFITMCCSPEILNLFKNEWISINKNEKDIKRLRLALNEVMFERGDSFGKK